MTRALPHANGGLSMKMVFLGLGSMLFTGCLGAVVGEKAQPYLQDEIEWNVRDGEVIAGKLDLRVHIVDHDLFKAGKVQTELRVRGKTVSDLDDDAYHVRYETQTDQAGKEWNEGPIAIELTVRTPDFEKTYGRTLVVNNITFNQKTNLTRPPFLSSNTDTHGWLMGKVERIPDMNRDGHDDLLILDGHKPYVRLSDDDPAKNYQTAWEISNDSWDSVAACDFNDDGHTDIVAGDPDDENGAGRIRVFYGPMTDSKAFASSQTWIGLADHHEGTTTFGGQTVQYNYTDYEGIGEHIICNSLERLTKVRFSSVNHNNNNSRRYSYSHESENLRHIKSNSQTSLLSIKTFNRSLVIVTDYNGDGRGDLLINNQVDEFEGGGNNSGAQVLTNLSSRPKLYISKSVVNSYEEINLPEQKWSGSGDYIIPTKSFTLGDLNQDGYDDFATTVIAWGLPPEGFPSPTEITGLTAKTTVYFGAKTYPGHKLAFYHPTNASPRTRFGEHVSTGDFNGDGYPDLAISSPAYDATKHPMPEVFVYYGPSFSRFDRYTGDTGTEALWFGHRTLAIDYNFDGRDDLLSSLWGGYGTGLTSHGNFSILFDQD